MNLVEDFYCLEALQDEENPPGDQFADDQDSLLTTDYMAKQDDAPKGSNFALKSVKVVTTDNMAKQDEAPKDSNLALKSVKIRCARTAKL